MSWKCYHHSRGNESRPHLAPRLKAKDLNPFWDIFSLQISLFFYLFQGKRLFLIFLTLRENVFFDSEGKLWKQHFFFSFGLRSNQGSDIMKLSSEINDAKNVIKELSKVCKATKMKLLS